VEPQRPGLKRPNKPGPKWGIYPPFKEPFFFPLGFKIKLSVPGDPMVPNQRREKKVNF